MKREDPGAKAVIRALCRAFLLTESVQWETAVRMEMHFSTLANTLSYKIGYAKNTKFILTSSDGDVEITILMGRPVSVVRVTLKNLVLCYEKIQ